MKERFFKFHGAGNDFILFDNRNGHLSLDSQQISQLCHRQFGIGADGLIVLASRKGVDFEMQFFNSDGNSAEMCGNGARCAVAFANKLEIISQKCQFIVADITHTAILQKLKNDLWNIKVSISDTETPQKDSNGFLTNTGVPHLVIFHSDIKSIDVATEGAKFRFNKKYQPKGVNVNFVQKIENGISIRTYERGVEAETLACGTGATAAALSFAELENISKGSVAVKALGGDLKIHFSKEDNFYKSIFLEGPAKLVFEGWIEL